MMNRWNWFLINVQILNSGYKKIRGRIPQWAATLRQSRYFNPITFLLFAGMATLFLTLHTDTIPFAIREGDVAQTDIKANQNYEIPDKRATERLRADAVNNVLPVYDWQTKRGEDLALRLDRLFATALSELEAKRRLGLSNLPLDRDAEHDKAALKQDLEKEFQFVFADEVYAILYSHGFPVEIIRTTQGLVKEMLSLPIIDRRDIATLARIPRITVRFVNGDTEEEADAQPFEETWENLSKLAYLDEVKRGFERRVEFALGGLAIGLKREEAHRLSEWLGELVSPTFKFDRAETEVRQQRASQSIKDVVIKVKAGEVIIRAGDRFNAWHKTVLEGIRNAHRETNAFLKFIGTLFLVSGLSLSLYYFCARYMKKARLASKDIYFLELSVLLGLLILRVGAWFAAASRDTLPVAIDTSDVYTIIPLAGMAMLVRMVFSLEIAFIFATFLSLLAGVYFGSSLEFVLYYLVTSMVGIYTVSYADKRVSIMRAGILSGLAGVVVILILSTISIFSVAATVDWQALVCTMLFALLGGVLSGVLALSIAPLAEFLFHYATDIKLLELANLNHPLLREMIVRAPGTYHHSHLVGILSEAGARAIGANPLLARVACYYHDIGKMCHPEYFIENQRGQSNRHDHLSPAASASVIAAHVRDGIELAKTHHLPPCIVDIIPQHQGTKIMTYFYEKAKSQTASPAAIDETLFRYPGPKPQSREAGIIMIADATEAAVRSMPQKTKETIEAMVRKLMNRHFSDGQFDECELTLQDLHLIAESFVHVLSGIYHHRIEYPESHEEEKSERIFILEEARMLKR